MDEKEIHFINDPCFNERDYFLKKFGTVIDSKGYRRKIFLRSFILGLIKASRKEKPLQTPPVILDLRSVKGIKPVRFQLPRARPLYPVKKLPYPKPAPLYQMKPVIKRHLAKKKLPPLKPKNKNVFMEDGKLYYNAEKINKSYLDQVKSILGDGGVRSIYCDGLNKPLLVDYFNYPQIFTKIKFSDGKRLNNMLKKLAKENKFKFEKNKPVILTKLRDGSIFQGNLGDEFIEPKFIIKKNEKSYKGGIL